MPLDEDPIFGKIPPPVRMPDIIPVQAASDEEADLWAHLPHRRFPARSLAVLAILVLALGGFGFAYFRAASFNSLELQADQLSEVGLSATSPADQTSSLVATVTPAASPSPSTNSLTACTSPIVVDPLNGFGLNQPAGWSTTVSQGIIFLAQANDFKKVIFLIPIHLFDPNLKELVTKKVTDWFLANLAQAGFVLTLQGTSLSGTYQGSHLQGQFEVRFSGARGLVAGGWAGSDEWPEAQRLLAETQACYQPTPAPILPIRTTTITDDLGTSVFRAAYPETWTMTNLTSQGFQLEAPDQARVRYQRSEGVLGNQTTTGLLDQALATLGFEEIQTLADSSPLEAIDTQGITWVSQTRSYTGRAGGLLRRGTVTVTVANTGDDFGFGSSTVITASRETNTSTWLATLPLLDAIQASLLFASPGSGQGLVLTPRDPGTPPLPLDRAELTRQIEDTLGNGAELVLTYYEAQQAPAGDQFLVPRVNRDPATGAFLLTRNGQTEMLTKITNP